MRKLISLTFAAYLLFTLTGCFSSSIMQTAKPAAQGEIETTFGASFYGGLGEPMGGVNVMIRTGVTQRSDIGLYYASGLYGNLKLDYKHNFWKSVNENVYFSAGLGFDILSSEGHNDANLFGACSLPLYLSWNHTKKAIFFMGHRITFGLKDTDVFGTEFPQNYNLEHHWFYAGGIGLKWGEKRTKWFVELSMALDNENTFYSGSSEGGNRQFRQNTTVQFTTGIMLGKRNSK